MSDFINAKVRLSGMVSRFDQAPDDVRSLVRERLHGASLILQGHLKRNSPRGVYGKLRDWQYKLDESETQLTANIFTRAEYALAVELGRQAAPVPIEPIKLWARRNLQLDEKAAARAAYFIAKKKRERPTPGQFFAQRTFEDVIPILNSQYLGPLGPLIVERLSR